jgi:myo-inositol-1(or 4)-monophosphatase
MSLNLQDIQQRQRVAETIARTVGQTARTRFLQRSFTVENKGVQDFVSEVDRQTEIDIRRMLHDCFPSDTFIGEEGGGNADGQQPTWVIDPIDGTANFVRGVAYWCVSIALVANGQMIAGVIYDPMADELFSAATGLGAMCNGQPIRVSATTDPTLAKLAVGFSYRQPVAVHIQSLQRLLAAQCEYRMMGAGALALAHVAAGRFDGYWEAHLNAWDALAGYLLVREAGGWCNDFLADDGLHKGHEALVATPALADFFHSITAT